MIILALMKQPALIMKVTLSVLVLKDIMEMANTIVAVSAHFSFYKIHTLGFSHVFKRLTILYLLINNTKGRFCSLPFICAIQSYSGGMFKLVNRNFYQKCDCDLHLPRFLFCSTANSSPTNKAAKVWTFLVAMITTLLTSALQ